jgi:hypothetical protein
MATELVNGGGHWREGGVVGSGWSMFSFAILSLYGIGSIRKGVRGVNSPMAMLPSETTKLKWKGELALADGRVHVLLIRFVPLFVDKGSFNT